MNTNATCLNERVTIRSNCQDCHLQYCLLRKSSISRYSWVGDFIDAWVNKYSVTWSTTERREIRNFPYPSVFKLTGHQRLTVKREIRNVSKFLAAEVTNQDQNESQEMLHSLTGWIKKEVLGHMVVRMNRLTGWRKKREAKWLARTLNRK